MTTIADNLQRVRERIATACQAHGRDPAEVTLLAVSKTFDASAVQQAFDAGQRAFGENYIQEAVNKIAALRHLRHLHLEWHCIGPVQSNKTRVVAENFDWVQSLDRLKIAQRLSDQRPTDLPPLQVCIQVNIDGGPNKSGVPEVEVAELAKQVLALPCLQLRGLMFIPEPAPDFEASCAVLARAKSLFGQIKSLSDLFPDAASRSRFDTLSMGMTADLEAAVSSGSSMVRVGTAIFGSRT
jgi:PLP dependent protein